MIVRATILWLLLPTLTWGGPSAGLRDHALGNLRLPLLSAAAGDEAVERGGDILGRGMVGRTHPFYDSQADDVRLLLPQPPPTSNFSFDPTAIGYVMIAAMVVVLVLILIFFLRRL